MAAQGVRRSDRRDGASAESAESAESADFDMAALDEVERQS